MELTGTVMIAIPNSNAQLMTSRRPLTAFTMTEAIRGDCKGTSEIRSNRIRHKPYTRGTEYLARIGQVSCAKDRNVPKALRAETAVRQDDALISIVRQFVSSTISLQTTERTRQYTTVGVAKCCGGTTSTHASMKQLLCKIASVATCTCAFAP